MRYTFKPDDCMVITIPLGNIQNVEGQLMPEKFTCVFKDAYKVFLRGRPKELGAAQFSIGLFVICIGVLITIQGGSHHLIYTIPSGLFIAGGILTCAAGSSPIMPVVRLSFIFNIIIIFWAVIASVLCVLMTAHHHYYVAWIYRSDQNMYTGLGVLVCVLCGVELILALVLIYWESKAVCRPHFNTLPLITIKQDV